MGAVSYTAVLEGDRWVRIGAHPQGVSLGQNYGYDEYELDVPKSAVIAEFYCSNIGHQSVVVRAFNTQAVELGSFQLADAWAVEHAIETVIITRHEGLVTWLAQKGIVGRVVAQAGVNDVCGKHVIGVLPLYLAAEANRITVVDLPGLTAEMRGKALSPDEMDAFGAQLQSYRVIRLE